jgi:hypothetical protein
MARSRRDVAAALVGCVRGDRLARLDGDGLALLGEAARRHGVSGFVWRAARRSGLAELAELADVRTDVAVAAARHLRAVADLGLIAGALAVPWLVFKGPVLAELVHPSPELRSYADVDVLVAPTDFAAAVAALESAGCVVYERNWSLVRGARLGSLRLHSPTGTLIDLHWHLVNDAADRAALRVDCAGVLARRRPVRLGSLEVPTMDPVDTVVHLALHAALAGAHRLVWLADVACATRGIADWDAVLARAGQWSAGPALAVVLHRTATVLGAPSPRTVLDAAAPSVRPPHTGSGVPPLHTVPGVDRRWLAVSALADRVSDVSRWTGGRSLAAAVARAARADGPASRRALRRRLLGLFGPPGLAPADLFDPANAGSVAYPAGGESERTAYLTEVAHQ